MGVWDQHVAGQKMALSLFQSATRGPRYPVQKKEKWTFRKISTDFKAADGPNRWVRTWGSMWRYPREFWGLTIRLLPTTGVCHQPMGHKLHDKKIISSSFFDCRQSILAQPILGQRSKIQLYLREIWARFSLWSKMVWAKGSKGRGAANLAEG